MNVPFVLAAGQNLFEDAWTQGDLYSIQPIVNVLGTFACWVISVVGFGIVIFSILKNALSGLYVINPKLWDKVDEIKEGVKSGTQQAFGGSGNQAVAKLGGLLTFILSYIPNVRALTDFADEQDVQAIDKKQYFAKSIPLLVAQIFIGMLIFQGYPAQIASWIGDGGTYAISAIMNNVDPVEFVSGISDSFVAYNLATDGTQDPLEKNINKMTSDMMVVVKTKYSDIQAEPAQETAYKIEDTLLKAFQGDIIFSNVLGATEGYRVTINTTVQTSVPVVSTSYKSINDSGVWVAQATNGTYSFKYWISGSTLPTGSTKVGSSDYFVWTVTATPEAISNTSGTSLLVFAGHGTGTTASSEYKMEIKGFTIGKGDNDIRGTLGKNVIVDLVDSTGAVVSSANAILKIASASVTEGATPVLSFGLNDKDNIKAALSGGKVSGKKIEYLRVNLVGSWSKTYDTGKTGTEIKVEEIRVICSKTSGDASYALTTWTDVSTTTTSGKTFTGANIATALSSKSSAEYETNINKGK